MIGLVSDVHGNYPALCAVLGELKKAGCETIYNLGDTCGYGCMVNECIDLIRSEGIVSLKGNHDSYLLGESVCKRSRTVNRCISYQQGVITQDNRSWLQGLQPSMRIADCFAVHGGLHDPLDEYVYEFDFDDPILVEYPYSTFLSGHTHIQTCSSRKGITHCNPGSVGQPRDHDPRAAYAVFDNQSVLLRRVEYDIDALAEKMQEAGFDEYYYSNLYHGCKIGEMR